MNFLQLEAIILKSSSFAEREKIITLFAPSRGLLRVFVKGDQAERSGLTASFTKGEFVLRQAGSGAFRLRDGKIIESYLPLRQSLEGLLAAEKIASLLISFSYGDALSELYVELDHALQFLSKTNRTEAILASFGLKVLKAEGVLQIDPICSACRQFLKEGSFRFGGERFCEKDAPYHAVSFSREEEFLLFYLYSASPEALIEIELEELFFTKVNVIVEQALSK